MDIGLYSTTHGVGYRDDVNFFVRSVPAEQQRPVEVAQLAERAGFHSMWFADHVCMPLLSASAHVANASGQRAYESRHNMLDVVVTMSVIAAGTTTLRLGPSVLIAPYRNPLSDARQFATFDLLSGGRLIFGVGAGWNEREHEMFHVPFLGVKGRMDRLEDGVKVIRETWQRSLPRPPREGKIPILMGGVGEKRHLPLVAREADEWNFTRFDMDEYRHKRAVVERCCKEIGRDPSSLRYSVMTTFIVGRDRDELRERALGMQKILPRLNGLDADGVLDSMRGSAFVGTPEEVAEQVRGYARLGVELFMLQHFLLDDSDALELLAAEVMPAIA